MQMTLIISIISLVILSPLYLNKISYPSQIKFLSVSLLSIFYYIFFSYFLVDHQLYLNAFLLQ